MTPVRESIRGLVLTPESRVLLLQYDEPRAGGVRWLTPGGGLQRGETPEQCLRRELAEETGLREFEAGPLIWRREFAARRISKRERIFLVRAPKFEPSARRMGRKERAVFRGFRWWEAAEIESSTERFEPLRLPAHLRELLERGPPERPVDVGR